MIDAKRFIKSLKKNKINFFSGTPDSVLVNFLEILKKEKNFYTAPHEGIATSAAIGYNYATNKIPCVFMQNSGLGNILNPISSIAHKKIFSVPIIIVIGMRGFKGDEPQHLIQIKSTPKILKSSDIDYFWLDKDKDIDRQVRYATNLAKKNKMPIAILVRKGSFLKNNTIKLKKIIQNKSIRSLGSSYLDYLKILSKYINKNDYVFSSTGFLHRTLLFIKEKFLSKKIFYNIGGMGHLSSIAYITAKLKKNNKIYCLEGDGSFLMHLGSQTLINKKKVSNFKYFLFNNESHFSTGGNINSNVKNLDLRLFAKSINLKYYKIKNFKELDTFMKNKNKNKNSFFLELLCNDDHLKKIPRPELKDIRFR